MTLVSVPKDATALDVLAQRYRAAFDKVKQGRAQWIEGTLELAAVLLEGREELKSDHAFSQWIERHGLQKISKDDRWALLGMADNPEATRKELERSDTFSWLQIWRKSPQRQVRRVSKLKQRINPRRKKQNRIPDVMKDDNPPPERKAVVLKGLTREQVDPDFKGTSLQFRTKYGHVHLQTKQEIEHNKRQEALMAWIGKVSDCDVAARAMLAAFAVDPAAFKEWMSKPAKAEKFRTWCGNIQLAYESLQQMLADGSKS